MRSFVVSEARAEDQGRKRICAIEAVARAGLRRARPGVEPGTAGLLTAPGQTHHALKCNPARFFSASATISANRATVPSDNGAGLCVASTFSAFCVHTSP